MSVNAASIEPVTPVLERSLAAAGVAVAAGAAAAVWYFDPTKAGFFPVCPLYSMTGLACPGCGMTRGFHALLHGDVLTALDYNALIPIFGLFIGYLLLSMLLIAVRGRGLGLKRLSSPVLWVMFGTMLAFAVLMNIPVYPFSVLYP